MALPASTVNQIALLEWQEPNPVQSRLGATGRPFTNRQAIECRIEMNSGKESFTDGQAQDVEKLLLVTNVQQVYFPTPGSPFGAIYSPTMLKNDRRVLCADGRSFSIDNSYDPDGDGDHLEAELSETTEGEGGTYDLKTITVPGCLPVPIPQGPPANP